MSRRKAGKKINKAKAWTSDEDERLRKLIISNATNRPSVLTASHNAGHRPDETGCFDDFPCTAAMPEISVPFPFRRTAAGPTQTR